MGCYRIAEIGGDGIGPEVVAEAVRVLEAVQSSELRFSFERAEVGAALYERTGEDLPRETVDLCRSVDAILFGAAGLPDVRHADGTELVPQVTLRMLLDLYAGMRPIKLYPGVPTPLKITDGRAIDYVIFRENTEGLYVGVEHYIGVGSDRKAAAESVMIVTRFGAERIVRYAFDYARRHARRKVTLVHKANILKLTQGLILEAGREIAKQFPEIAFEDRIIDATAMALVLDPSRFDVIVTENMFGDILSDEMAGLVGGLGFAPAANVGSDVAIFEAVHGSAPDIAGQGVANPTALMLAACLMLDHQGEREAARRVRAAVEGVWREGHARTRDAGGQASTAELTDAVIAKLRA